MWLVYLAPLVVGLGVLLLQVVLGPHGHGADHDALSPDHGDSKDGASGEAGLAGILLSVRFWIFAALAFGLSGSLINALALAGPLATALIAAGAGVASGAFAVLAFRTVTRGSLSTTPLASEAVGQTARVLVPLAKGQVGQVRIQIKGNSVDMMATTDEDELARGEAVLVEDVNGGVARVSRRPAELG